MQVLGNILFLRIIIGNTIFIFYIKSMEIINIKYDLLEINEYNKTK